MSELQEQPPSLRQLQNKRKARTATAEELETLRSYERESKQRSRDAERAQTDAGRKMASSRIVVNKDEAKEILKERGLRDIHSRSAHIRRVIYRLSKTAAEILGLPGPNYHLLRWGVIATKIALTAGADYVPKAPENGIADPDGFDDGELVTRRELCAMLELSHAAVLAKKIDDAQDVPLTREEAIDALDVSPERKAFYREVCTLFDRAESGDIDVQHAILGEAMDMDLEKLSPQQRTELDTLDDDAWIKRMAEMPCTSRVIQRYHLTLD
jgi:hypothetical protein